MKEQNEAYPERAEARIKRALARLEALLPGKARAYGEAHALQRPLMEALLEQYKAGPGHYLIPDELLDHLPRMTRLFDRMARIMAHPGTDDGGENPWEDMAGDCVAAMTLSDRPEPEFHAGGFYRAPGVPACAEPDDDDTAQGRASHDPEPRARRVCGETIITAGVTVPQTQAVCMLLDGHEGPHKDQRGVPEIRK